MPSGGLVAYLFHRQADKANLIYRQEFKEKLSQIESELMEKIDIVERDNGNIRDYEVIGKVNGKANEIKELALLRAMEEAVSMDADGLIDLAYYTSDGMDVSSDRVQVSRSPSLLGNGKITGVSGGDVTVKKYTVHHCVATAIKFTISKEEHKVRFTEDQAYEAINKANTLFTNGMISEEECKRRIIEAKKKRELYIKYLANYKK